MSERASPLLVGPINCEAVLGVPWRRARDAAVELGVRRVRLGRAMLLPAAELVAALKREHDGDPNAGTAVTDPAAALRERLGLRVVGGAR